MTVPILVAPRRGHRPEHRAGSSPAGAATCSHQAASPTISRRHRLENQDTAHTSDDSGSRTGPQPPIDGHPPPQPYTSAHSSDQTLTSQEPNRQCPPRTDADRPERHQKSGADPDPTSPPQNERSRSAPETVHSDPPERSLQDHHEPRKPRSTWRNSGDRGRLARVELRGFEPLTP